MPTYEIYGKEVQFQKQPSPEDIDHVGQKILASQKGADAADLQTAAANMYGDPNAVDAKEPSALKELVPSLARGVVKGGQTALGTGVNAYELLSKLVGKTPNQAPRQLLQDSQQGLDALIPAPETALGSIAEGVGEIPNMIATYANPVAEAVGAVPLAAGIGAVNSQEGGLSEMVKGGAIGAAEMAAFQGANKLPIAPRIAAGAAISGVPSALSGNDSNKVIADTTIGAGFMMFNPKAVDDTMNTIKQIKSVVKDPKAAGQEIWKKIITDPNEATKMQFESDQAHIDLLDNAMKTQDKLESQRMGELKQESETDRLTREAQMTNAQKETKLKLDQLKQRSDQAADNLEQLKSKTEAQIPDEARKQALFLQGKIPEIQSRMSQAYEPAFRSALESVDSKTQQQTQQILGGIHKANSDIVTDTGDTNNPLVRLHNNFENELTKLQFKNKPEPVEDAVAQFMEENNLNPIFRKGIEKSIADKNMKDLTKLSSRGGEKSLNDLMTRLSPEGSTPDMVPLAEVAKMYKRNVIDKLDYKSHEATLARQFLGDQIAMNNPKFSRLQKAYAENISFMRRIRSMTGANKGVASTDQGTSYFDRVAKGQMGPEDKALLSWIEKGYRGKGGDKVMKFEGVGDVSSDFKGIQRQLSEYQKAIQSEKDVDFGRYATEASRIMQINNLKLMQMEQAGKLNQEKLATSIQDAKIQIQKLRDKLDLEFTQKSDILKGKKNEFNRTQSIRKRIENMISAFSFSLGAFGAWKLGRLGMAGAKIDKVAR